MTGQIGDFLDAWQLDLAKANLKPSTISIYISSVRRLLNFLRQHDMPGDVDAVTHEQIESFLESTRLRADDTAGSRHPGLYAFFKWLQNRGEIELNPLSPVHHSRDAVSSSNLLTDEQIQALIATCEADTDFESRRDLAILFLFIDEGLRRHELISLRLWREDEKGERASGDIDLASGVLHVPGRAQSNRAVSIGLDTRDALARYLHARARHLHAGDPWLWLSRRRGPFADQSLYYMIKRRAQDAGLPPIHPSQLRRSARRSRGRRPRP